jgi:hypothetical protein
MSSLKGVGLKFDESMSGWLGVGADDYVDGRVMGEEQNTPLRFDARIVIDDLDNFLELSDHRARLEGTGPSPPWAAPSPWKTDSSNSSRSIRPPVSAR